MAEQVLLLQGQLGQVPAVGEDEDRVVAESPVAARFGGDHAFQDALAFEPAAVGKEKDGHAAEVRRWPARFQRAERVEQGAAELGAGRGLARESPGAQAGGPAERGDLEAGVLPQGGHAADPHTHRRLGARVLQVGRAVLRDLERLAQLGRRVQIDREVPEQGGQLGQLAGVVRGEEEPGQVRPSA